MKYLVIGAGAMGSVLAGHMTRTGRDVTVIGRGDNLRAIQDHGLKLDTPTIGNVIVPLKIMAEEDYDDRPDVIIISVKAYALDTIIPFLDRVCEDGKTVVLPLLNAIRMGDAIAGELTKKPQVLEGVAWVACERLGDGHVRQKLDFFDIFFGMRAGHAPIPELEIIKQDLIDSGANAAISPNMLQSTLRKFARVSTASAALVYYGGTVGDIAADPDKMAYLEALTRELIQIAEAAGCPFPEDDDVLEFTLHSARTVFPAYRTSLKWDVDAGRPAEFQTQFFDVYELGRSLGLEMAAYEKISRKCGYDK